MMFHRNGFRGAFVALCAAAAMFSLFSSSAFAQAKKLRVSVVGSTDAAALYSGMKFGYFANEGLDVEIVPTGGGAAAIPGLIGGSFDMVYGNLVSTILAVQQGLDLKIVAATTQGGESDTIVTRKADDLKSGADLNGKTLAVNNRNNLMWLYGRVWVKVTGGDPDKVTYKEVPFPQMLDAVKQRQVDAALVVDPFKALAETDPQLDVLGSVYKRVQPNIQFGQWITSGDFLKKNPDTVARFYRALQRSNEWYGANMSSPELFQILAERSGLSVDVISKLKLGRPMIQVDIDEMNKALVLMRENGLLTANLDAKSLVYQPQK